MAHTYSFPITVFNELTVTVESETELTPQEVLEKAKVGECDFCLEDFDMKEVGYVLRRITADDLGLDEEEG